METSIASSVIVEVGKCLFVPTKEGFLYLYRYQKNIKKLENQIKELKAKLATIERLVEEGRNTSSEEPTEEVKNWFVKVNNAIQDNTKIEEETERERQRRLCGWCPNCCKCYRLSKKAAEMAEEVKEIIEQGNKITRISFARPTPSVEPILDNSVAFASADSILDRIMQALQDNEKKIIGVHGMGGVGKTTLMKRLNNKLREIKLFDKVIMVTVSKNLNVRIIQDVFVKRLDFKLTDVDPNIRARKLSERLEEEKKVLIILDDVWSRFELNEVGIPCSSEHEGCKIILTTRNKDVCRQMGTQWNIELEVLPDAESWALLKRKAGDVVDSNIIKPIAKQILKSCKGLPLAIVTIGSTLRMQEDERMWNDALHALNSASASELEGVMPEVIESIRFSYDSLKGEGIKRFFLLCCLFPEDWQINPYTLQVYGIGEGCFRECRNYQDARDKSCVFIEKLKASSLLLPSKWLNTSETENTYVSYVVMHDIVRDVAIHIASNEHDFIVRSGLKLDEWPEMEELGRCSTISFMNNEITTLPNNPECPKKLLSLILRGNRYLEKMPDLFFENMMSLVFLDLGETAIHQLPSSISHLKCLRVLLLGECVELKEISAIEGLERLETLDLARTAIRELPRGIKGLTNLKSLDLSQTKSLNDSSNLISSLSRLEELYMIKKFSEWETGDEGDGRKAHDLSMVALLPRLAILHVVVRNSNFWCQDHFASLKTLTSFQIRDPSIHYSWCRELSRHCLRWIDIKDINILDISDWVKVLLQKTENLRIYRVEGLKNILQLGARGLNNLTTFSIDNDYEMEYLINVDEAESPHIAFPRLTRVWLRNVQSLISIWKGVVPVGSINNLEDLIIESCDKLKYLFSTALMQALQNLERLYIFTCNGMDKIISDEEETVVAGDSVLPQELPKPLAFCSLKMLDISHCNNLKYVFPYKLVQNLVHLARLAVIECYEMREIIVIDKEEAPIDENVLPMLMEIELRDLPKLRTICKGRPTFHWPSLEEMHVQGCPQLMWLPMGSQSAPKLRKFEVAEKEWLDGLEWKDQTIKARLSDLSSVL